VQPTSETRREHASPSAPELRNLGAPAFAPLPRAARPRRAWCGLEALLWSVAAASAIYLAYVFADRALWSHEANRLLSDGAGDPAAVAAATETGEAARKPPPFLARLEIPTIDLTALVVDGIDELTLRRAVGRIPSSSRPGEPGDVALAGHRDTDFRSLQRLKQGDRVELATSEGKFAYEVEWIRIVAPERVDVLAPDATPSLTLVTCYPFRYVGRAPLRYVVRAREVSRPPLLVARS